MQVRHFLNERTFAAKNATSSPPQNVEKIIIFAAAFLRSHVSSYHQPLFSTQVEDLEKQAAQLSSSASKILPKELKDLKLPTVDVPPEPGTVDGLPEGYGEAVFSPFWEGTGGWIMMDPMFWEDGEAIGCSFIRMIQCTKEIRTTSDSPRN